MPGRRRSSQTVECPYCYGTIPAEASKCRHCGEWVKERPVVPATPPIDRNAPTSTGSISRFFRGERLDETLNEGVKVWAKLQIVGFIVGLIAFIAIAGSMCSQSQSPGLPPGF